MIDLRCSVKLIVMSHQQECLKIIWRFASSNCQICISLYTLNVCPVCFVGNTVNMCTQDAHGIPYTDDITAMIEK